MDADLDLNTSPDLPASAGSTDGASGGALGDASMADLRRGYSSGTQKAERTSDDSDLMQGIDTPQGFLGRPHGWER